MSLSYMRIPELECDVLGCEEVFEGTPGDLSKPTRKWAAAEGWTQPHPGEDVCPAHSGNARRRVNPVSTTS